MLNRSAFTFDRITAGIMPPDGPQDGRLLTVVGVMLILVCGLMFFHQPAMASTAHLPGEDASSKMEAAGTLLRFIDTGLFKWGARLFAGICVLTAAWLLKEMRFGAAVVCVIAALIFGTAPKWVKNIFEISDEQSLFSMNKIALPFKV